MDTVRKKQVEGKVLREGFCEVCLELFEDL